MKRTIIYKAESFRYPSSMEIKQIQQQGPKNSRPKAPYKPAFIEIIKGKDFIESIRNEDVYWWCGDVNNKLGYLDLTYVFVKTHLMRIRSESNPQTEQHSPDELLADYYLNVFYLHYFSAVEGIAQLINIALNIGLHEHQIKLNDFSNKINNPLLKNSFLEFISNTESARKRRNAFAHRYSPTHADQRAQINIKREGTTIQFFELETFRHSPLFDEIDFLMEELSKLTSVLSKEIETITKNE